MSILKGRADIVNWPLYDRISLAAGATTPAEFSFFTVPQGSGGKTKADTNVTQVKTLPSPEYFNCTHVGIEWAIDTFEEDIIALLNNYWLEFHVYNKVYAEGPIGLFPSGTGISRESTKTNKTTSSNGIPAGINALWDLRLPAGLIEKDNGQLNEGLEGITILQNQSFFILLKGTPFTVDAAGPGLKLRAYLHGQLSRGVQ